MKPYILILRGLSSLLMSVVLTSCSFKKSSIKNQIVVKVSDQSLTAEHFAENLAYKLKNYGVLSAKDKNLVERFKKDVVREFIILVLTQSWAKENNIIIKKEELDQEIALIRKHYPDSVSFRMALSKESIDFKTWKQKLSQSLLQKKVSQSLSQKLKTPEEAVLKKHYKANKYLLKDRVKISQIVLESEADAKHINAEMRRGKPLSELAKSFSITPEAKKGGDIGWIEKGTLDIFEPAFKMRVGEKSKIIKSPFGYHIFTVKGKRKAKKVPFKEARLQIIKELLKKREQALFTKWLEEQVRKVKVYTHQEMIQKITVNTRIAK